jgi:hypothetical protein
MTPRSTQAWLNQVEDMMRHKAHLTERQQEELVANHRAALMQRERAILKANQLKVKNGRVVGPTERYFLSSNTLGIRSQGKTNTLH